MINMFYFPECLMERSKYGLVHFKEALERWEGETLWEGVSGLRKKGENPLKWSWRFVVWVSRMDAKLLSKETAVCMRKTCYLYGVLFWLIWLRLHREAMFFWLVLLLQLMTTLLSHCIKRLHQDLYNTYPYNTHIQNNTICVTPLEMRNNTGNVMGWYVWYAESDFGGKVVSLRSHR